MKSDPLFQRLREAAWRRKLTSAEEAELRSLLARDPQAQADWQAERRLTETLAELPPAPVPGNFTARVLGAVERENRRGSARPGWALFQWLLRWLPRTAAAILVLGVGLLVYEHDVSSRRTARRAQDLVIVSELPPVASPDLLENFDAVQAMGQTASADNELIQLLQ